MCWLETVDHQVLPRLNVIHYKALFVWTGGTALLILYRMLAKRWKCACACTPISVYHYIFEEFSQDWLWFVWKCKMNFTCQHGLVFVIVRACGQLASGHSCLGSELAASHHPCSPALIQRLWEVIWVPWLSSTLSVPWRGIWYGYLPILNAKAPRLAFDGS